MTAFVEAGNNSFDMKQKQTTVHILLKLTDETH